MIRTQVQLTEQQASTLKREAAARGVSMAEVLRQLVDAHLAVGSVDERLDRAQRVVGKYRSGRGDVSRSHDRELADAFAR